MASDYDGLKDGAESYAEGLKAMRYRLINDGKIEASPVEKSGPSNTGRRSTNQRQKRPTSSKHLGGDAVCGCR